MIDSNTLYYTFSTIAQALAGTLAVLAAFVVPYVKSWAAFKERGWSGVHELFRMLPGWHAPSGMRQTCEVGYASYQLWPDVRPRIRRALHFTVGDIGLCLVALPFTPLLTKLLAVAWAAVVLAVGLALFCLWLYVDLVTWILPSSHD